MSDPIRCSSCDAIVDRVFVDRNRLRASCSRCAFQFDVRCLACRGPLGGAAETSRGVLARCRSCQQRFGRIAAVDSPVGGPESGEDDRLERTPSRGSLRVEVRVETEEIEGYREQRGPGTLTVSVEDPERAARLSAYAAERASFERSRPIDGRRITLGIATVLARLFELRHGEQHGSAAERIVLAGLKRIGDWLDRHPPLVLPEPQPPARRGGAARVSAAGLEVRDDAGRWRAATAPSDVRRVRVDHDGSAYTVRVETEGGGDLTLVEGLPDPDDAADIAERVEEHLAKLRSSGG